ncbi:hypothetical protein RM550_11145 [Streptomyces sp. DSM 41527]|uniref:Uncharacterized protein n=1 Tax=Streptomyces mooreae TaxID=3075523 RepID=A0ABU2T507_9ACTN|nr:hypothetical protein [Streptomyces sp. DSM 41527]MDT0456293.1 hypothetical protein [Streptomyces sp. DSM 41527]
MSLMLCTIGSRLRCPRVVAPAVIAGCGGGAAEPRYCFRPPVSHRVEGLARVLRLRHKPRSRPEVGRLLLCDFCLGRAVVRRQPVHLGQSFFPGRVFGEGGDAVGFCAVGLYEIPQFGLGHQFGLAQGGCGIGHCFAGVLGVVAQFAAFRGGGFGPVVESPGALAFPVGPGLSGVCLEVVGDSGDLFAGVDQVGSHRDDQQVVAVGHHVVEGLMGHVLEVGAALNA